jgi:hypothetical protein
VLKIFSAVFAFSAVKRWEIQTRVQGMGVGIRG